MELAQKDLNRCFPNGLEQNGQSLLCIEAEVNGQLSLVGYLWHCVNIEDKSTFIYDFYVFNEHRGFNYGKQAMSELEKQMRHRGIEQIKLRVAYHNERALKLYQAVGFSITGFNMAKNIDAL